MLNLKQLKEKQKEYLKNNDLQSLNKINKMLFEFREKQRKAKELARAQEREKVLSAKKVLSVKISAFCEKVLSAKISAFCEK